jgi:hypothetical protein
MKKIILFLSFTVFLFCFFVQANSIKPVVDERVELMSTVFRLAEAKEYVNNDLVSYTKEFDDFFAPIKEHEIIPYIHKLRQEYGVGYDAVMRYAINLEIQNGIITFITNVADSSIEARWTEKTSKEFLELLNDFYQKSNFRTFFDSHKDLHEVASQNFKSILESVDFEWFEKFYGTKSDDNYRVILSLLNGGNNYGPALEYKDGKRDVFSIIGTWQTDSLENPVYSPYVLSTLIHEFNHSFCNKLIDENVNTLYPQAKKFYKLFAAELAQQAYGDAKTLLYEILVRACVFQYQYEKKQYTDEELAAELNIFKLRGYLWIDELFKALTIYQNNRSQYPALSDFMPEIIKLQNSLSPQKLYKDMYKEGGKIISCSIENGAKDVDYNIDRITIKFNQPMDSRANGISYGPKGTKFFPEFYDDKEDIWTEKEWTFFVKLKPDTEYSLLFPGRFFRTKKGYPIINKYVLNFKTGKE